MIDYDDANMANFKESEPVNSSMSYSESSEFEATPKKKVPLSERLDNISRKIKERHATTVVEMDLLEAYQLGKTEPVVSQDQEIKPKQFIAEWQDSKETTEEFLKHFTITRKPID